MNIEIEELNSEINKEISELRSIFEKNNFLFKCKKLEKKIEDKNFWSNRKEAENILKEKKNLDNLINSQLTIEKDLLELYEIYKLALSENDSDYLDEILNKLKVLKNFSKEVEIKCFLSGESDSLNCYLEFHAGAGGQVSRLGWYVKANVYEMGNK